MLSIINCGLTVIINKIQMKSNAKCSINMHYISVGGTGSCVVVQSDGSRCCMQSLHPAVGGKILYHNFNI